jgi:hypothetical protein
MTEERKHAILFAVTLLCARKLIETLSEYISWLSESTSRFGRLTGASRVHLRQLSLLSLLVTLSQ